MPSGCRRTNKGLRGAGSIRVGDGKAHAVCAALGADQRQLPFCIPIQQVGGGRVEFGDRYRDARRLRSGECCLPNSASGHDEVGKARQNGSRLGVDDLRQTLDGGGGAVPGSFQERLHALLNGTGVEGIFQARSELPNAGGEVIEFTKGIPVVLACCSSGDFLFQLDEKRAQVDDGQSFDPPTAGPMTLAWPKVCRRLSTGASPSGTGCGL